MHKIVIMQLKQQQQQQTNQKSIKLKIQFMSVAIKSR